MRFFNLSWLVFALLWSLNLEAVSISAQRSYYVQAKEALSKNNSKVYFKYGYWLDDYPLKSYLAYEELTLRLKTASNTEIAQFIKGHQDLPQIGWMRLRWLRNLAEKNDWQEFLKHYVNDGRFIELDCLHAFYQLNLGDKKIGHEQASKLWLSSKQRPSACNATFDLWSAQGGLTEDLRLQRLLLVLSESKPNLDLASAINKNLKNLAKYGQLALKIQKNPEEIKDLKQFMPANKYNAQIVAFGLTQLARKDLEAAYNLLKTAEKKFNFADESKLKLAQTLGLRLAWQLQPTAYNLLQKYDPNFSNNEISNWKLRLLLQSQNWAKVARFIEQAPMHLQQTTKYKYWHARSLASLNPHHLEARKVLNDLAQQHHFYAFLAADMLQKPYQTKVNTKITPQISKEVRQIPALKRALELYAIGELSSANLEWDLLLKKLNAEQLAYAAELAHQKKWYWGSIKASNRSKGLISDLNVVFPMPYQQIVSNKANEHQVSHSWIYAVMRQESAFTPDAKSSSGAQGLMQIMPQTATYIAKKHKIDFHPKQIYAPETNIALGSVYLKQLHEQFAQNRILATAAYNAGPNRVRRWLANTDHLPIDVWIEIIPYDETRGYVQNVLAFAVAYSFKMGNKAKLLQPHEYNLKINEESQNANSLQKLKNYFAHLK